MAYPQVFGVCGRAKMLFLVLLIAGCQGKSGPRDESAEVKHIRNAWELCKQYGDLKKKRPASIDEVQEWAIKEGKATEEDFISTRDKQPYGIAFMPMGAIVYEQAGKNGKCFMLAMGSATELTKDALDRQIEGFRSVRMGPEKGAGKGGGKTR